MLALIRVINCFEWQIDGLASNLYASVVFLCDDFLKLPPAGGHNMERQEPECKVRKQQPQSMPQAQVQVHVEPRPLKEENAIRFFKIAKRLPMDLQMLLCNRTYNSTKDYLPRTVTEGSFKVIGKDLAVLSRTIHASKERGEKEAGGLFGRAAKRQCVMM